VDGELIAIAQVLDDEFLADGVGVRLVVDEAHRGRGYGRAMAAALERAIAERAPAMVEVRVVDGDRASREWAERRGFRVHHRMVRSYLHVDDFRPDRHRAVVERVEAAGLRLERSSDEDRLYDLFARLIRDSPDAPEVPSRQWFSRNAAQPGVIHLVARDGATWAGMASSLPRGPHDAWNGFTGVLPEYRGRGVARALKATLTAEVVRQGRRRIGTSNNAENAPMLAVNRALGYRVEAVVLFMRR
jgi:GNAT superfamily N-acetyltransferase